MIMILYSTSVEIFQRHKNFLSTGHGAYLTGRSAAQLMIRFISIQTFTTTIIIITMMIIITIISISSTFTISVLICLVTFFVITTTIMLILMLTTPPPVTITVILILQNGERPEQLWRRDDLQPARRLSFRPQCMASGGTMTKLLSLGWTLAFQLERKIS